MNILEKTMMYSKYVSENTKYYEERKDKQGVEFVVEGIDEKWGIETEDPIWKYYNISGMLIPMQGWKIHISVALNEAAEVLQTVSEILVSQEIAFKHIRSEKVLQEMYSKHGNRTTSGKFITIYPQGEEFIEILSILEQKLKGFRKGPYILTDKRWKDTNIYFRYGAFKKIVSPTGELCLIDNEGKMIPDIREPRYYVPPFVKIPKKLLEADMSVSENKEIKENKLKLYKIKKALRYSNGGGIYLGERISDGLKCIIKEARAEIGYDGQNHSAGERLNNEYLSLCRLKDIQGIVKLEDYFKVWENTFLVEEYVEGLELAQWIVANYPFCPSDNISKYISNVVLIIEQLKRIIVDMHQSGVAMCDLQTRNVLLSNDLKVTLIDFEVATAPDNQEAPGMITKGFTHYLNEKASDKDWYALNRILQFMFLPIGAVTDIDMNLNSVHCLWIKENFGQTAYDYFLKFQLECCEHLTNAKKIFGSTYDIKYQKDFWLEDNNLQDHINKLLIGLKNGLIQNCQTDRKNLINGDIRQYEQNCGKYNLLTGSFGAILPLYRTGGFSEQLQIWINNYIEDIFEAEYNDGFLSGRSGIAATLYECGFIDEALKLTDLILGNYMLDTFDLTLRSGLSGIGLMLLAAYLETSNIKYLKEAEKIANDMREKISSNKPLTMTDWDSISIGLIDGLSGISLFYSFLYKISEKEEDMQFAKELIGRDLKNCIIAEKDGSLQTLDAETSRVLPYLANGSIGIGIAISVFNKMSSSKEFMDELTAIAKVAEYRCCFDAGLFDGASGFLLLSTLCNCNGSSNTIKAIKKLHLFTIKNEDKIYIPGKWFYKLSSDMYSGTAGVMLALQAQQKQNCLYWLPLLHKYL